MYKHFFGLRENPFNINPDPRYLFLTPQTQKALDQLTYGIQTRQGLILLTGEVGTGKTTVINRLRAWLHQQQMPTAFIFNSHLGTGDLFDCMLADFAVPPAPQLNGNATRLNQWLLSRYRAGELPVLIVDEAQGLPTDVLEEIRMLLNWETPGRKAAPNRTRRPAGAGDEAQLSRASSAKAADCIPVQDCGAYSPGNSRLHSVAPENRRRSGQTDLRVSGHPSRVLLLTWNPACH